MADDIFTESDVEQGTETPILGPAYWAANRCAESIMAGVDGEQFKPVIDKAVDEIRQKCYDYIQEWIINDLQTNVSGHIRHMVERTVRALLTGEQWALDQYPMAKYHDGEAIRKAVAVHGGEPLLMARIADLEKENKRLEESLKWARS